MPTTLKINNFSIVFLALFFMFSCHDKIQFNQYTSINSEGWKADEKVVFEFEVTDTISLKNLFINIRNNSTYEYSNLYLITELILPNKISVVDTLHYQMTNAAGVFLGDGFTEIKENKLFYKEKQAFPIQGTYRFTLRQAMRKNGVVAPIAFLKGIQDVGFSIENLD